MLYNGLKDINLFSLLDTSAGRKLSHFDKFSINLQRNCGTVELLVFFWLKFATGTLVHHKVGSKNESHMGILKPHR